MDTSRHIAIVQATDPWRGPTFRAAMLRALVQMEGDGLLCTEVEREFIEAWRQFYLDPDYNDPARVLAAEAALKAERAGASKPEVGGLVSGGRVWEGEPGIVKLVHRTPEDRAAYFEGECHKAMAEAAELRLEVARLSVWDKTFMVQFDGGHRTVNAPDMKAAIVAWHGAMRLEQGEDWTGDEEPDSCQLLSDDGPLIIAARLNAEKGAGDA